MYFMFLSKYFIQIHSAFCNTYFNCIVHIARKIYTYFLNSKNRILCHVIGCHSSFIPVRSNTANKPYLKRTVNMVRTHFMGLYIWR